MSLAGQTAPQFSLINTEKEPIELKSFQGKKVIIAFYPAAFSGICDQELCTFRDRLDTLNEANAVVLGVSPDSPFANKKFAETYDLKFDLLSDLHLDAAEAYGVVFENFAFIDGYTSCNRAVFIIDEEGLIQYEWVAEHPGIQPDYDVVLQKALA